MRLGESGQEQVASIESEAQELATLVEEILAFSRAGNRSPRIQDVPVEPLVREVVAREAGGHSVRVSVAPDLRIHSDSSLLGRAIGNLVRNARIHGLAAVVARIVPCPPAAPAASPVHPSAAGPGVARDVRARLFEPFYRPDRSRSRDTGGSGLGLAIVRTAMEACGGEASASIPAGGGFAVTLRLPAGTAANA